MPISILVAYATRGGSTAEVAEAIGAVLREERFPAEVAPVVDLKSLPEATELILGAPLYVGRFPKEFHAFMTQNRERLEQIRPWCFVLGPTRSRPEDFTASHRQAEKQLGRYGWLHPADLEVFGGRWSKSALPFPFSLALRIPGHPLDKIPAEDVRDWAAIRAWARGIARQIGREESHPESAGEGRNIPSIRQ